MIKVITINDLPPATRREGLLLELRQLHQKLTTVDESLRDDIRTQIRHTNASIAKLDEVVS